MLITQRGYICPKLREGIYAQNDVLLLNWWVKSHDYTVVSALKILSFHVSCF